MLKIRETIIVEGRYDKAALSQIVDTIILETAGFGIFSDGDKLKLIRRLAEKNGVVVLTDSDSAGFIIRGYLKSAIGADNLKHAYIPDIFGKERRKRIAGKEGKLGVEGIDKAALTEALLRSGATIIDNDDRDFPKSDNPDSGKTLPASAPEKITKYDLYAAGYSGAPGSSVRRAALLKRLNLPERLSANALPEVLSALMTREEFLGQITDNR